MLGALLRRVHGFKQRPAPRYAILALCVLGVAYGVYYYMPQFARTPAHLWPWVPDSPEAVFWATAALVLYSFGGRRVPELDALAFVGNVQVGLWTMYVLAAYADAFGTWSVGINFVLFWAHGGMVALAFPFVRDLARDGTPRRWIAIGVAAGWYLLNDVLDYLALKGLYGTGCGLRPITVPCDPAMEGTLTGVTFALTGLSVVALLVLASLAAPHRAEPR